MSDYKCPFCGSDKPFIVTPYIDRITGEPKKTPCCAKQKQNTEFRKKRYHPQYSDPIDLEDISKI